jgi:hypothetical protein
MERRLAATMAADVVAYLRLIRAPFALQSILGLV